jgi:hypothetical protein
MPTFLFVKYGMGYWIPRLLKIKILILIDFFLIFEIAGAMFLKNVWV